MTLTSAEQKLVNEKVWVTREVDLDYLGLEQVTERFVEFSEENGVPLNEILIDIETQTGRYGDDAYYVCSLRGWREATEQEKQDREKDILRNKERQASIRKQDKQRAEEAERKTYERLKKKFERGSIKAAE